MVATKLSFFDISASDRGDFPRIIEIALLVLLLLQDINSDIQEDVKFNP